MGVSHEQGDKGMSKVIGIKEVRKNLKYLDDRVSHISGRVPVLYRDNELCQAMANFKVETVVMDIIPEEKHAIIFSEKITIYRERMCFEKIKAGKITIKQYHEIKAAINSREGK